MRFVLLLRMLYEIESGIVKKYHAAGIVEFRSSKIEILVVKAVVEGQTNSLFSRREINRGKRQNTKNQDHPC